MKDKRCEPIYHTLSVKYDNDTIDSISLYTLISIYLQDKKVPSIKDVHKYIVYDAVFGSGPL